MFGPDGQCEHPTFIDSDDENLLLDDDNSTATCASCNRMKNGYVRKDYEQYTRSTTGHMHVDEHLDSPEDSPLLHNERINSFGHLSVKDFHCHTTSNYNDNTRAYKTLCTVSVLCFVFMIIEIVGGYIAGSLAVMTDAAHLLSDLIGFLVSIIAIWIGRRPRTHQMTFGYHRAEVLGAFLSVLVVWLLAGVFSVLAVDRIIRKEYNIDADTMLVIAGLGLFINIVMGAVLHGFCQKSHPHSHGVVNHGHAHSDNLNIRAAAAHVIGDLLQSVGVVLAAISIKIFPEAEISDPICTILFSVIVVVVTIRVAKDSILLLVEASPSSSKDISDALKGIAGVKHVHSLHVWSLAPGKEALATHLAVDDNCDRDVVLNQATFVVKNKLRVLSCTIQIEPYDHEQISTCNECQLLQ